MDKGIECFYSGTSVKKILVDTTTEKLYISGGFAQDGNCVAMRGVAEWDGQHWDSMGVTVEGNTYKKTMCVFNSDVYMCGNFYNVNTEEYLARWNGTLWDTITKSPNGSILCYAEKGNDLYLGGNFDRLGNDSTFLLGKYNGTQFSAITPYYGPQGGAAIHAMAFYQDTLYVGGFFHMLPYKTIGSFAKWDETDFQLVTSAFANNGANCAIQAMVVYNNELYLGGYFKQINGYAGNYIMKYNGSTFTDVGGGMNERVTCMRVYNGELYVGGAFTQAGSVISHHVAKWNGSTWTSLSTDTFNGTYPLVQDIDIYKDSLIVAGDFTAINGDTMMQRIAKYASPLTGINEKPSLISSRIYPNPATDHLTIEYQGNNKKSAINIQNTLGQIIYTRTISDSKFEIDIRTFPTGVYILQLFEGQNMLTKKFIKQ